MKITDVQAIQLRIKNIENIFDGTQDVLIVQVETDAGITGLGEVVSSSYVAKATVEAPRSGAGRHGLREIIKGLDPRDTEAVWEAMCEGTSWYGGSGVVRHAMAGIDVALWDIKGQVSGQPVYRALGAARAEAVRAYASVLWGDTVGETRRLAEDFARLGFQAVKFGFGPIGTSLTQDLEMVGAARDVLGSARDLMVDVGRRWDVPRAIERCQAFEPLRVSWVEEPLHPDDLEGYAVLSSSVAVPIAAAETADTLAGFKAFMDAGVKVIQPDLGRVGLTLGMQIATLARDRGLRCVPHCFGTGVNTTASIHWMVAVEGDLVEYPMRTNLLCRNLVSGLPPLQDGTVRPFETPGLGTRLDPAILAEYRVGNRASDILA